VEQWEIQKALGQCYATGKNFQPGDEYFAALVQTEQGLERRDYSLEYWDQQSPEVYCYWKSKMSTGREKKKLFVDDEMLMSFFERLSDEQDQEKINFRFVLMLILMRKRILKYDSSDIGHNGKEVWHLKVTGQDRTVDVLNPDLTEDMIEQISSQMSQILKVDL
jgi:hypothetical protein